MEEKKKTKKFTWRSYIPAALFLIMGGFCGVLFAKYSVHDVVGEKSLVYIFVAMGMLYVLIFFHIVIHELGHMIFGLISGYGFSSFRVFNFMWVKEEDRIRFRRHSIVGTGGQCLMVPPDLRDGRIPVVLYNLGGSIMNFIISLVSFGIYLIFKDVQVFSDTMLMSAVVGVVLGTINIIPAKMGEINNDGSNALELSRSHKAIYSFWVQMKVNEQLTRMVRLKDMPDEWFKIPEDEEMKNSMTSVLGVLTCSRLIDERNFSKAYELIRHFLEMDSEIIGLHRKLLVCECIYCELIGENRLEILREFFTVNQEKFMKSMKKFPSVQRTQYAYALLSERDVVKAEKIKMQFEKGAKAFPYQGEIEAEREMMEIAKKRND